MRRAVSTLAHPGVGVLIVCIPERQSANTGLDLARRFERVGNRVAFVGPNIPAHKKHVEANGFPYHCIGPDVEEVAVRARTSGRLSGIRALLDARRQTIRDAEAFVAKHAPGFHLAVMDVNTTSISSYLAARAGVPSILYCSGYTSSFSVDYPPATFNRRLPSRRDLPSVGDKLTNLVLWTATIARRSVPQWVKSPAFMLGEWSTRRKAEQLGARFCYGEWGVRLRAPEIAVAYKPIDWPALQRKESRMYLFRDKESRSEYADVDWRAQLHDGQTLVYCTLGAIVSHVWKDRDRKVLASGWVSVKRYLDNVIAAIGTRPEWHLVVAAGPLFEAFDQGSLPRNVRVLEWVPQDDVLRRAGLAITAGGSATVRDCVFFGVPMLVMPLWTDHFGNAARVAYHKLGIDGGDFRKTTPSGLVGLIERVLLDTEVLRSVASAKDRFMTAGDDQALAAFVERYTSVRLGST